MLKRIVQILLALVIVVVVAIGGGLAWLRWGNSYKTNGELQMAGLSAPVRVLRDGHGIPYIFAQNTADLIRAQGFVTAQHRLFQLEAYRALIFGRVAEVVGEAGLESDRQMRTLGLAQNARRHAKLLSPQARDFLTWYAEGLSAYAALTADHPVELKLAGFRVGPWSLDDMVAVLHFVNFSHATNYRAELLMQAMIDRLGFEKAKALFPLNVNPDRKAQLASLAGTQVVEGLNVQDLILQNGAPIAPIELGSNNWAVSAARSASGATIVSNDPHLDARTLPGIWHPVGLFAPGIQAVGAALPGVPGLTVGRTPHVAFGVTNGYGDSQDLFVETVDPANPSNYLDNGASVPFETREEIIRVKDSKAEGGLREEKLTVRSTKRGPVVGTAANGRVLALRMASAEIPGGPLGIENLLTAKTVQEVDAAAQQMGVMYFNYVFGDSSGAVGHRATGLVPLRASGHGVFPKPAETAAADWRGFIPPDRLPGQIAPARGWVGTANHDTQPDNYPYHYGSYFSPPYRYATIKNRIENGPAMKAEDHLKLMQDISNAQARMLAPKIAAALQGGKHADLATILGGWDFHERTDSAAPTIYHAIYEALALQTFNDELGPDLAKRWLSSWYTWQSRFDALLENPASPWFDDAATPAVETLPDMIQRAADSARADLEAKYGPKPQDWLWGKVHTIAFVSPLRRSGAGKELLGTAPRPYAGSGETVQRALSAYGQGFETRFFASLRFIADFSDSEKVMAAVSGGVAERQFGPHQTDQLEAWMDGRLLPWWFAPQAVEANARQVLVLKP